MACHGAKKVSPYQLVYGHEATDEYSALMKDELEDLAGHRLKALANVEANKARVDRWYDKNVKAKAFDQGELFWKLILPIGTKSSKFGKWSPT